jgi:hypothetical protein
MPSVEIRYRGFGHTDVLVPGRGAVRVARDQIVRVPDALADELVGRGGWDLIVPDPPAEPEPTRTGIVPWPGDGPDDPFAPMLDPVELEKLSRAELNHLASVHGVVNAERLPNKPAVVAAIMEAQPK